MQDDRRTEAQASVFFLFLYLLPWAKAFLTALLMHMEETVAPETKSTSLSLFWTISSTMAFALFPFPFS